jgi:uncharacterized membrane protein
MLTTIFFLPVNWMVSNLYAKAEVLANADISFLSLHLIAILLSFEMTWTGVACMLDFDAWFDLCR